MSALEQDKVAAEFDTYQGHYAETVDAALALPGLKVDFFTRVKAVSYTHLTLPTILLV